MTEKHSTLLRDTVVTLAGIVILLAAGSYASGIVVPFLLALFITAIAVTPVTWLKNKGIPDTLSVWLVLLVVIVLLLLLSVIIGTSLTQFNVALPEYQARFTALMNRMILFLSTKGINISNSGILKAIDPAVAMNFVNTLLTGLADILSKSVLILFTTMFMLFDFTDFPRKFTSYEGSSSAKILEQVTLIIRSTYEYTAIKAIMSILTGILIYLGLKLIGLDFAILWGIIAFILNFIPNIGSILAAVPAILLGLIQLDPGKSLIIIALYITVNMVVGNVIEPKIMGKKLGLSTLAVFLSLVFWGWLLGPVGMLLSVPLTMVLKSIAVNSPQLKWLAVLLSPSPEEKKREIIS